jgi:hypothetical protein
MKRRQNNETIFENAKEPHPKELNPYGPGENFQETSIIKLEFSAMVTNPYAKVNDIEQVLTALIKPLRK